MVDDLYQYEEPVNLKNRHDLDLSKINIYLHKILNLTGLRSFKMRVFYGKIAEDGSFQMAEERFNDELVFVDSNINLFYDLEYLPGYNHIKIEILDASFSVYDTSHVIIKCLTL